MFDSRGLVPSFRETLTITGCKNCPNAAVNPDHEKFCLLSPSNHFVDAANLCKDNVEKLTASCPGLARSVPKVDLVVKGWYAALSDVRHNKAVDEHTRGKIAEIHAHLIGEN